MWPTAAGLVLTPIAIAALIIAVIPAEHDRTEIAVSVTESDCAKEWKSASGGTQTFQVQNKSGKVGEVNLVNNAGGIVGEIETIGPGTTAEMTATLGDGDYTFKCYLSGQPVMSSAAAQVTNAGSTSSTALKPVSIEELTPANDDYQKAAAAALTALTANVKTLKEDLAMGDIPGAKSDLLAAQMNW
ncbi:MAG TPA: iron permease, partial [Promineifilum sp.]|nr:iron permease [Promineifilum sp.]